MLDSSESETNLGHEHVLLQELATRANDVQLRVRLVTLYQRTSRLAEAWDLCLEVQYAHPLIENKDWNNCVVRIAEDYQAQYKDKCGVEFYSLYLASLDRLMHCLAREGCTASVLADILHRMDQGLYKLSHTTPPPLPNFISHLKGQLYLCCATLLTKRAVERVVGESSGNLIWFLLLKAFGEEIVPEHSKAGEVRKVIAGYLLQQFPVENIERLTGLTMNIGVRLHTAVFLKLHQRERMSSSSLAQQTSALNSCSRVPTISELRTHCPAYLAEFTSDLHSVVWLLTRYYRTGEVLKFDFSLPGQGAQIPTESLTSIDIESFLYALVYCVGREMKEERGDLPPLPPVLAPVLTSTVQEGWWKVAMKALTGKLQPIDRLTLKHGVEALRCQGLHEMDMILTMKLGKTFEMLSLDSSVSEERAAVLEERATIFFLATLVSIVRSEEGGALRETNARLFPEAGKIQERAEMEKMKKSALFYLALQKMKKSENMDTVVAFKDLGSPYALYYIAEIYKNLAQKSNQSDPGFGGIADGDRVNLLLNCRQSLYCLRRLSEVGEGHNPLHSRLVDRTKEVETLLNKLRPSENIQSSSLIHGKLVNQAELSVSVNTENNTEFLFQLDDLLSAENQKKDESNNSQGTLLIKDYFTDLYDRLDIESAVNSVVKLVCEDGRVVSIPLQLISLAWPQLAQILKENNCCGFIEVFISVPGNSCTVQYVKQLLLFGRTSDMDCKAISKILKFLSNVGLDLNISNVKSDEVLEETFIEQSEESDDSNDPEESQDNLKFFWDQRVPVTVRSDAHHCSARCTMNCDRVSIEWSSDDINCVRAMFQSERNVHRKNKLISHLTAQGNIGSPTDTYVIKSQRFCLKNLSFLTGISEFVLKKVLEDYWRGIRHYEHGSQGIFKQPSVATIRFIGWFKQFLLLYGQSAPDEELIILPYWLRGKVLYKMYCDEVSKPRIALPTFYRYLKTYFGPQRIDKSYPCIRISKYSSHSVCDVCVTLNFNLKLCKTEAELNLVKGLTNQHKIDFGMARKTIESIKQTAINYPQDNIFIQVDGMDNAKSYCPRYLENSKELVGTERLPTKIYGGLVWSGFFEERRSITFFLNHDHYENGSDMIVSIVYHLLKEFMDGQDGKLPRKLHLNLDNCFRENKNRYLFSWLANLVELNIFLEVSINFLIKGHTGNEVDQLFSILATEFKSEILTVDDLKQKILDSPMNPKPKCKTLWYIYGWSSYISNQLSDPPLQNHSRYNSFLISLEDSQAKLRGKRLPQHTLLVPRAGIRLLKEGHMNVPVAAADFRIEKINFDNIMKGLKIYLSRRNLEDRMKITASWDCLREKLEGLPRRSSTLEKMDIRTFPEQSEDTPEIPESLRQNDNVPELMGDLFPEEIDDGRIEEIAVKMDVCVYTENRVGRPWVGRIVELVENRRFKLQWYGRKTKRSKIFKALNNPDGSPMLAELDYETVMFWMMSEPQSRTDNSFSLSPYWLETIEREYEVYDDKE